MAYYDLGTSGTQQHWSAWWEAPPAEMHAVLSGLTRYMREQQDSARRGRVLRWLRMYGNYAGAVSSVKLEESRLRDNIIAENVDTAISEVTLQEPKAAFLVDGGDWTLAQGAKARESLVDAALRECGWYDGEGGYGLGRMTMRDAAITGQGAVIVREDWHCLKPRVERILPLELLVDEADGRRGKPRSIHLTYPCDRGELAARYSAMDPKLARKVMNREVVPRWVANTDGGVEDWFIHDSDRADMVLVTESWHLPSHDGAKDGLHVAVVEGLTLECSRYDDDTFPVVWVNWKPSPVGFFGIGLGQDLQADQIELNRVLIKLQDAIGVAAGMWLLPKGARINPRHLTDVPGGVVEYQGNPPSWIQPNTFPGDLIEHAERIRQRARGRSGINDMAATGAKPAGFQSGEAIRSYRDQFSMRQSPHAGAYESLTVAVARRIVASYGRIYRGLTDGESMPEVPVAVKRGRKKVLKRLRWEENDSASAKAVITAYPMSALPNHPASRTETVQEWYAGGLINAEEARSLLDFQDTDGAMNLALADHDYALFAFETMTEDGKYVAPEPYQNLALSFELMRRAYLRASIDGAPDSRLELVRKHLAAIERMQRKAKSAAQPPAPAAAPAPPVDAALPPDAAAPAPDMAGLIEAPPVGMVA